MNLLTILGGYDEMFNTTDAYEYFGHEITNFIEYYNAGMCDEAVDMIRAICEEVNNFAGYELICDLSLDTTGCSIQLCDGEIAQII